MPERRSAEEGNLDASLTVKVNPVSGHPLKMN